MTTEGKMASNGSLAFGMTDPDQSRMAAMGVIGWWPPLKPSVHLRSKHASFPCSMLYGYLSGNHAQQWLPWVEDWTKAPGRCFPPGLIGIKDYANTGMHAVEIS